MVLLLDLQRNMSIIDILMEYKMIYKFCYVFILILFMITNCTYKTNSSNGDVFKGSLLVIVPSKEGLVVCADKRGYSGNKGVEDNQKKLFKINSENAFSITGNVAVYNKSGTGHLFNSVDITKQYTSSTNFDATETCLNGLGEELKKGFNAYLNSMKFEDRPDDDPQKDYEFLQVIFFNISKLKESQIPVIRFKYQKGNLVNRTSVTDFKVTPMNLAMAFTATGRTEIIAELLSGNKKDFDALRADTLLKPFLTNSIKKEQVKITDAVNFAKKIMEVSSKNIPLYISPDCDCAILDYKTGYREIK